MGIMDKIKERKENKALEEKLRYEYEEQHISELDDTRLRFLVKNNTPLKDKAEEELKSRKYEEIKEKAEKKAKAGSGHKQVKEIGRKTGKAIFGFLDDMTEPKTDKDGKAVNLEERVRRIM